MYVIRYSIVFRLTHQSVSTNSMSEIIVLLLLSVFFLLYTFGFFHALILDDWRPWKHGIKWWK